MEKSKPSRTFTKRVTVGVVVWAMALPIIAMLWKEELFTTALTWMVPLICAVIGTYQGIGHVDYRVAKDAFKNEIEGGGE